MAINDTVQLTVQGFAGGERHLHTLHFRYAALSSTEQGLIDAWQATSRTTYRAQFQAAAAPVQALTARQVCGSVPLRAPLEEIELVANQPGTLNDSSQAGPSWVARVVSVRTALAGKSRRGRFYIGGMTDFTIESNNVSTDGRNATQAYVNSLMAAFVGAARSQADYALVVHSGKLAASGVDCDLSSTPVTGMIVRTLLGSMRSRKPGRGD